MANLLKLEVFVLNYQPKLRRETRASKSRRLDHKPVPYREPMPKLWQKVFAK